ncbi:acyltransferase family protein [Streptomyces sp. NPDC006654]|uniref:acyltransferase family protein n=1 Tax=unclassified Streptomyces TaxID=2593676 RepID=UPI0033E254A1
MGPSVARSAPAAPGGTPSPTSSRPSATGSAAPATGATPSDPGGRPSAGRGRPPAARRDAYFDNAKYLAIVLVAVGHAWEPLRSDSRTVTALYTFVYAFHMPAFIIISGYFSRGFDASPARVRRLVTGVVVPYVVFEVAYTLFTRWSDHAPDRDISLLNPLYLTWFLAALFIWRLTTPIWRQLRWPLPVALAVATLASVSSSIGGDLDLQRVLQFLPYFVLGLSLRPEHFGLLRRWSVRLCAVPVAAAALAVAYWSVPHLGYRWFFHRDSAQQLGVPAWYGPVMTFATFGCSLLLVACFLAWVPGRRTWFTVLGAGTLYGYLLHGFVAQAAKPAHWYAPSWMHGPLGAVTVTLVAAVVVTLLCTPPVRRVFRCVMEPGMRWAFRTGDGQEGRVAQDGGRNAARVLPGSR